MAAYSVQCPQCWEQSLYILGALGVFVEWREEGKEKEKKGRERRKERKECRKGGSNANK